MVSDRCCKRSGPECPDQRGDPATAWTIKVGLPSSANAFLHALGHFYQFLLTAPEGRLLVRLGDLRRSQRQREGCAVSSRPFVRRATGSLWRNAVVSPTLTRFAVRRRGICIDGGPRPPDICHRIGTGRGIVTVTGGVQRGSEVRLRFMRRQPHLATGRLLRL